MPSKFYGRIGLVDAVTFLSVLPVAAASNLMDAGTMKTPFRSDGTKFYRHFLHSLTLARERATRSAQHKGARDTRPDTCVSAAVWVLRLR